jgi:competence protein ComEC
MLGYSWQLKLRLLFKDYFRDDSVRGVAEAVIFGFKEDLNEDWLKAFSKTGTIHVLAVSGLHVGIIYVLMSFLLGMQKSRGTSLVVKSAVILLVLFLYALLTGFSPSVSRASIMFGTVIIGNSFNRKSSIYNSLSLACFILLLINPLNIYNVGFQFSFIAVLGIVYFKDDVRRLFPDSNYFFDKVFILMSVSIAAQIATFPLGLFYFHQYPNLFMFSNLIVIPCISIVLYLGIAFIFIVQLSSSLGEVISDVIGIYIQFIADSVKSIQNIPFAFFEGVYITTTQMILLYLLIIIVSLSIKYKWKSGLMYTVMCVVIFIVNDWVYLNKVRQNEVVVFDAGKELLIGFKRNNHMNFLTSDNLLKDEKKMEYIVKPYLIANRLNRQYSIFPASLLHTNVNLVNIKLLGNEVVWFDNHAYKLNTDICEIKKYK